MRLREGRISEVDGRRSTEPISESAQSTAGRAANEGTASGASGSGFGAQY